MKRIKPTEKRTGKKLGLRYWLGLFILLLVLHCFPVRFGLLRLFLVGGAVTLWGGALWLIGKRPLIQGTLLAVSIGFVAFCLWPSRAPDPQALRQDYVRALKSYNNTTYIWGGENKLGIDCSGLIRCALVDANVTYSLTQANPAALREGLWLWWHDCSANALKEQYQGKTRPLFAARAINKIDPAALQPGDMAVTADGLHVLAYLGEQTWIEADPTVSRLGRVIQVTTPTTNGWFDRSVHLMRWRQLE